MNADVHWGEVYRERFWGLIGMLCLGSMLLFGFSELQAALLIALLIVGVSLDTALCSRRGYWDPTGRGPFCFGCGADAESYVDDCVACAEG